MKQRKLSELNAEEKKIAVMALRKYGKLGWLSYVKEVEDFIKHQNLEPTTIEVGKVYKSNSGNNYFIAMVTSKKGDDCFSCHGFNSLGEWFNSDGSYLDDDITEATESEWFEALEKEAKRIGYKPYVKMRLLDGFITNGFTESEFKYLFKDGILYIYSDVYPVMKDGIWAEIVDEKQEIRDQIEKLESELVKLKEML